MSINTTATRPPVIRAYSLTVPAFDHLKAIQRGLQAQVSHRVNNSAALETIVREHQAVREGAATGANLPEDVREHLARFQRVSGAPSALDALVTILRTHAAYAELAETMGEDVTKGYDAIVATLRLHRDGYRFEGSMVPSAAPVAAH